MTFLLLLILLLTPNKVTAGTKVTADTKITAEDAFNKLTKLTGIWKKEAADNSDFRIYFELTANNSVLIETWLRKGKKHSLTLYHLDHDDLIATHYCPQGNQPRLKLTNNSTSKNLSFAFFDATNLKTITDSHQHSLSFELSANENRVIRHESYLSQSNEDSASLILQRTNEH